MEVGEVTSAESRPELVLLEPGSVLLGCDLGSQMHAADQPRHEVRIAHEVWISTTCITKEQWNAHCPEEHRYAEVDDMQGMADSVSHPEIEAFLVGLNAADTRRDDLVFRLVSEAEWELCLLQREALGIVELPQGSGEILADQPHASFWGAACDGRPRFEESRNRGGFDMQVTRRPNPLWRKSMIRGAAPHSSRQTGLGFRVARVPSSLEQQDCVHLPSEPDRASILRREVFFFLMVGVLPSMIWAGYFVPDYISRGWPNLLLGGSMVSLFTAFIWRPRRPTWVVDDGRMVPIPPSSRDPLRSEVPPAD